IVNKKRISSGEKQNLELTIPLDSSSPSLEIESNILKFNAASLKQYIPAKKMPPKVVEWLDHAILAGQIKEGWLNFAGSLDAFPFDGGEGALQGFARLENGVVQFMEDWPLAENLTGTMEFFNTGFKGRGSGQILGYRSHDILVSFKDLRDGTMTVQAAAAGAMKDFVSLLKGVPTILEYLGPELQRLDSGAGYSEVSVDLSLPLRNPTSYKLEADLKILDGELFVEGFSPRATEINGTLNLRQGVVTGEGITAKWLNGPVLAHILRTNEIGYRTRLDFDGEVDAKALGATFDLPFIGYLDGWTQWRGSLFLPADSNELRAPLKINIGSSLSGLALKFPDPMFKAASEPTNFSADFLFSPGQLEVRGNLGVARRFMLNFRNQDSGLIFSRGGVRFGGADPLLPSEEGLLIQGFLPLLRLDDWLDISPGASSRTWHGLGLFDVNLMISEFSAFGQRLGNSDLDISRVGTQWFVDIESEAVAGKLVVPSDLSGRGQIRADMSRLYLSPKDENSMQEADPRDLPGFLVQAEQFAIGNRQLGRLEADIQADPLGLRVVSFRAAGESFAVGGDGSWFDGPSGPVTRFALTLNSTDVAATLTALGFSPVAEGEYADFTAGISWSGPPSTNWSEHVNGNVTVHMKEGSVLDLEPGAGRVVGLMSITALPRRLALDFRDVFNRGLVFDELTGDFTIVDGNAYTDNFKLTGPVAEIGVVGRTGLRDRDWQQQAVVTAEPGNMLPTVGAILGGGGVGAALLIFTQIFKEPLKGIGRASYCLTGTWDEPVVEQLSPEELQEGRICAGAPPGGFSIANP
ncbi:MAG: AsmA-like C-terminal region-containing protein, partial [Gammaproteobacteria bacterium]